MLILKRLVAAACLFLISTLALAAEQPAKSAGDYWPFKEGSTWTFETKVGTKTLTQVITVTKVTTKDGKTTAELEYKTDGVAAQLETYEVDAKSISRVSSGAKGASKLNPPLPVVQFPMTAGKSWDWKGQVTVGDNKPVDAAGKLTASGPEEVKTDAGTFSAMKVRLDLELTMGAEKMKVTNDYWFAANVGMVKQSVTINNMNIEGNLKSYELAK